MGVILDPRDEAPELADVRLFLQAVRDGKEPLSIEDLNIPFYILGLSPNASRLSVRFWQESNVGEIITRVGQHFQDMAMVRGERDPEFPGIWQLLRETAAQGKTKIFHPYWRER
jgi:CRISPR-associated protein Csd1